MNFKEKNEDGGIFRKPTLFLSLLLIFDSVHSFMAGIFLYLKYVFCTTYRGKNAH